MPVSAALRTVLILVNPAAGGARPDLIEQVGRRVAGCGARTRLARTEAPGQATDLVRSLGREPAATRPDTLVVVGGDGTLGEVAAGLSWLAETQPRETVPALVAVPAGTGNSFYREVWADRPWAETLSESLTGGRAGVRWLDYARVLENGTGVLLGACTGLVAEALVAARELGAVTGRDRYDRAVAATLARFQPYPGRVEVDGVEIFSGPVIFANIGGGRYRGGRYQLLPRSVLDDGLLDVCVAGGPLRPRDLPGVTARGRHLGLPGVAYGRGRQVRVERTDGLPLTFEHDGELFDDGRTAYTVEVLPGAVPVRTGPAGARAPQPQRETAP
jgi:diacylglycerol kinase (ATP)